MFNPEPPSVTRGRRFLYDALDQRPRRLGLRDLSRLQRQRRPGLESRQPGRRRDPEQQSDPDRPPLPFPPFDHDFQAMKGPLTTQSLRGMANHGPMHWRGDRTGSLDEPNVQPDSGAYDEREALRQFQAGFVGLLGRAEELSSDGHRGLHRFPAAGHVPAEPDPQPRRLLDRGSAGRPRLLLQPDQRLGRRSPAGLPHSGSRRQRRVRRAVPGLLRHRRPAGNSRSSRSCSRSRTCATSTPRSACSDSRSI